MTFVASPMEIYQDMLKAYGSQHWWPSDDAFEMMVGAILTQNTSWQNVEKALENLRNANVLAAETMMTCNQDMLESWVRPAGFFRQKTERLIELCYFYMEREGVQGMKRWPTRALRSRLLDVHGIGPETADCILLYAVEKPVFVVDAYTKRIFYRLGLLPKDMQDYDDIQSFFHQRLAHTLSVFQEFHALIVAHAKAHCRSTPLCDACPLLARCEHGKRSITPVEDNEAI